MTQKPVHQYICTLEAGGEKLESVMPGLDLRHGALHFLTSDAGMAMALRNKISADVLHEFPCNFDRACSVEDEGWKISIVRIEPAHGEA